MSSLKGRPATSLWCHTLSFNTIFREDVEYRDWCDDNAEFLKQRAHRYLPDNTGDKMDIATAEQFFMMSDVFGINIHEIYVERNISIYLLLIYHYHNYLV